jgi:hypothetical protein
MRTSESARARVVLLLVGAALATVGMLFWPAPEAVLATDSDGDGLSDAEEAAFGTDPNQVDTDGDNLTDFNEIYYTGTAPGNPDTDMDGETDDVDATPLAADTNPGGCSAVSASYSTNLTPKEALPGTSAAEGVGVYVHNGEMVYSQPLLHVRGRKMDMDFSITYRSGITYNGPVGRNWEWSFPKIEEQGNGDVLYRNVHLFDVDDDDPNQRTYTSPAGFPGALVLDKNAMEWQMTFPNGYEETFEAASGDQDRPKGGVTELGFMTRWNSGIGFTWTQQQITTVTDDLNRNYTITYYGTGRVQKITDFSGREVELKYNCKDQLVWVRSPDCATTSPGAGSRSSATRRTSTRR